MATKKHTNHPHLTGEHRWGDLGQLILFFLFIAVYVSDSFFLEYSIFLTEYVSNSIRIPVALALFICAAVLARGGMKKVFGSKRSEPGVITDGVFRYVRHPIYLGAILFYLAAIILSLSIISFVLWVVFTTCYNAFCFL